MSNPKTTDKAKPPRPPISQLPPMVVAEPLTMEDLAVLLVKHHNLHTGQYDLMIEFQVGSSNFGTDPSKIVPGMMVGIKRIGLVQHSGGAIGSITVDAAMVNPD